jgi:hypothetical protein
MKNSRASSPAKSAGVTNPRNGGSLGALLAFRAGEPTFSPFQ